jgi:transposase
VQQLFAWRREHRERAGGGAERDWLLQRIGERPDITLHELVAELAARGVKTSYGAVWRFYDRHGISFKKNRARQRAGSTRRRPAA